MGICAVRVEQQIPWKSRLPPSCIQYLGQLMAKSVPTTFMEHIRKKRMDLKMTQNELGKRVSVCLFTVSKWECAKEVPRQGARRNLVKWLGFDPERTKEVNDDKLVGELESEQAGALEANCQKWARAVERPG